MEVRPDCRHQEAKSNGFDVKIIREIVRLRKQDQKDREELDELLDVYLRAIKGASRVPRPLNPDGEPTQLACALHSIELAAPRAGLFLPAFSRRFHGAAALAAALY
jgi:hypothetical protein